MGVVPPPPPPSVHPAPSRRQMLLGVAVGVVLAAVVAGVLFAVGALHVGDSKDSSSTKVDATPITLPEELASFDDQLAAATAKGAPAATLTSMKARLAKVAGLTSAAYQDAYHGAAAAVRSYSDSGLEHLATVIAVRAGSPGLTDGVVQDAASLGLAVPLSAIAQFGDVSCRVNQQQAVVAGKPVDPEKALYSLCERTGPGLTIIVSGSGFTGDAGRRQMVALVDAAFDSVAAG